MLRVKIERPRAVLWISYDQRSLVMFPLQFVFVLAAPLTDIEEIRPGVFDVSGYRYFRLKER